MEGMNQDVMLKHLPKITTQWHPVPRAEHGRIARKTVSRLCYLWTTAQDIIESNSLYVRPVFVHISDAC
jgi:hypothetical protein